MLHVQEVRAATRLTLHLDGTLATFLQATIDTMSRAVEIAQRAGKLVQPQRAKMFVHPSYRDISATAYNS